MTTGKRIRLYLMGFVIGSILVYFLLLRGKNRTYWLPQNRVKEQVQKSTFTFSDHAKCVLDCKNISEEEVKDVLKTGDINFSESDTHGVSCPSYAIEGSCHNKKIRVLVTIFERDSTAQITTAINLEGGKDSCNCK